MSSPEGSPTSHPYRVLARGKAGQAERKWIRQDVSRVSEPDSPRNAAQPAATFSGSPYRGARYQGTSGDRTGNRSSCRPSRGLLSGHQPNW